MKPVEKTKVSYLVRRQSLAVGFMTKAAGLSNKGDKITLLLMQPMPHLTMIEIYYTFEVEIGLSPSRISYRPLRPWMYGRQGMTQKGHASRGGKEIWSALREPVSCCHGTGFFYCPFFMKEQP